MINKNYGILSSVPLDNPEAQGMNFPQQQESF